MGSIDSSRHMQHMRHRPGPRRMAVTTWSGPLWVASRQPQLRFWHQRGSEEMVVNIVARPKQSDRSTVSRRWASETKRQITEAVVKIAKVAEQAWVRPWYAPNKSPLESHLVRIYIRIKVDGKPTRQISTCSCVTTQTLKKECTSWRGILGVCHEYVLTFMGCTVGSRSIFIHSANRK